MSAAGFGVLWKGGDEAVDKGAKNSDRSAKFIISLIWVLLTYLLT